MFWFVVICSDLMEWPPNAHFVGHTVVDAKSSISDCIAIWLKVYTDLALDVLLSPKRPCVRLCFVLLCCWATHVAKHDMDLITIRMKRFAGAFCQQIHGSSKAICWESLPMNLVSVSLSGKLQSLQLGAAAEFSSFSVLTACWEQWHGWQRSSLFENGLVELFIRSNR